MTSDVASVRRRMEQLARDYQRILQKARTTEQRQLEEYQARLAILVERYALAKPAPPKPLTIPRIFNQAYGENFISDYLAYILAPGKNGIGEAPLARFLSVCGIDAAELPLSEVQIHREYPLENGRIDLLLEWEDTFVLGIENKILSAEGPEQTARYARAIRRLCGETPYHLVYLTRGGERGGSRKFQPLSYAQLAAGLRGVQLPEQVTARRRVLWEDFLEHLEVYIIMSDPEHFEFSEKAQLYLEHLDMILDLESAWSAEWEDAVSSIGSQVAAQLEGSSWTIAFDGKRSWQQAYKSTWRSASVWPHYEYWFSTGHFRQQEFSFMVHVEGKQRDDILSLFDQRHPDLEATYRERGIDYRPRHQGHAIAWKTYPAPRDIAKIGQEFVDALNEFRFLEKEIDEVLAEWRQQNEGMG